MNHIMSFWLKLNFMVPFYGCGSNEPLRGDNLIFTTNFPEIIETHFTSEAWESEWTLKPPSGFELYQND